MRLLWLATVVLSGLVACTPTGQAGEVRLLDLWLSQSTRAMSDKFQTTIRGVTRSGIPVNVGGRESVKFTVPRNAVLRVVVSVSNSEQVPLAAGITASIATCDSSDDRVLASVRLMPRNETPDWIDLELDLSSDAGRALKLCFIASSDGSEAPPSTRTAVWFGNPVVRSPGFIGNPGKRLNLIIITLDTTRADHLSSAGYPLPTTPNLDRLATDGEQFLHAIAIAPWTLPSHASLFTGLYPREHGARGDPEGDIERLWRLRGLSPQAVLLAERLAAVGYRTAAVVGGPMVGAAFGFARGFEYYDQRGTEEDKLEHRRGDEITDIALSQVSRESGPFFLFLNYFDPHWPYMPDADLVQQWVPVGVKPIPPDQQDQIWKEVLSGQRNITADEKQSMVSHYDGAIASMDRAIGRLFAGLKERGLYDSTMIVAVSDHGESFGEHQMLDHGHSLYEDVLRAALIIKYPSRHAPAPSKVSQQLVDWLDVYATICREMGLPIAARLEGFGVHHPPHDHFAELELNPFYVLQYGSRFDRTLEAVYRDRLKLIRDDKGQRWLFDLVADPLEERNLAETQPEEVAALGKALDDWAARSAVTRLQGTNVDLTPSLKERLRALGYGGD
jgi:arylsulfatase A-like enzyme